MELTINELDDISVLDSACSKNVTWRVPETDGSNEPAFSAQQYNPDDFQPRTNNASLARASLARRQTNQPQPQQPVKREPLNYDDILLKLNVQIVNGVMRYVDPRRGFTFENAVITKLPAQVKPQVKPQPLTAEEHKECRIKQEMDRRRLNQVKTTKMLIPNNNATISRPSVNSAPLAKAPATKGSGMFKMKMGR